MSASRVRNFSRPVFMLVGMSMLVSISVSCSLFDRRSPTKVQSQATPVLKDVPFDARASKDAPLRKRLMVLPVINLSGPVSERVAASARESFLRQLRRTDDFVVIANSDFPKDINAFIKGDHFDLESMAKVASAMGVSGILETSIVEVKTRQLGDEVGLMRKVRAKMTAKIRMRMVNARNGSVILDETRETEAEESTTRVATRSAQDKSLENDPVLLEATLSRAFSSVIPKIAQSLEKLSWEGRVAMVKGDRVFLNAGRISGLQIGDVLRVSEDGEDVYDPETGAFIGRVPGRLKGTIEIISYFGKDGAVAIVHSGSGFRENDLVELY
ncbi:MAG TPA: hypothetical protein PLZ57_06535 [Pseudobdellovibrionaceae bacterium]|nr:hypothetical protein [Pseudobdellovibrionaceae bacterium]